MNSDRIISLSSMAWLRLNHSVSGASRSYSAGLKRAARGWVARQSLRLQIIEERRQLAELPDHVLADIGIDRVDALQESRKGAYDLPRDRLRDAMRQNR